MYSSSLAIAVQSNGSRFGATVVAYCGNGTNGEGKSGGLQKWQKKGKDATVTAHHLLFVLLHFNFNYMSGPTFCFLYNNIQFPES